jgi:restriction system protein
MARRKKDDEATEILIGLLVAAPWRVQMVLGIALLVTSGVLAVFPPHRLYSEFALVLAVIVAASMAAGWWQRKQQRELLDKQRSLDSIKALSWREFERMVGELYLRKGYQVGYTRDGADGGVDIHLTRGLERAIVQCKRWRTKAVGVQPVRELFGLMAHHKVQRGIFVTCDRYTAEARAFAQGKAIDLIDGEQLLARINEARANQATAGAGRDSVGSTPTR